MAKERFRLGCIECGTIQTEGIDLHNDADIAGLGIIVAELLDNGHVVVVTSDGGSAARTIVQFAHFSAQQQ